MRRNQQVFLAHHQIRGVQRCKLEAVTMRNSVCRTGLYAVTAEDAAVVIDVIDLGVALSRRNALLFRVLGSLNIDAVRRTGSRAEKARNTLLQTILIALQLVLAAETLLEFGAAHRPLAIRIVLDLSRLEHLLKRDAHSLGNSSGVAKFRHTLSIRRGRDTLEAMNRAPALSGLIALCFLSMTPAFSYGQSTPTMPMAEHAHAPASPSTSLTLTIDGKATTLSAADLQAMPQKTVTVHNKHLKVDETYSGVPLGDLLTKYGFPVDKTTHQKMLRSYLKAEGTDKYWALYSVTEVEPSEHNADVIVAIAQSGKPLGEDGQFKLIDSGDKKPQRWVRNLSAITLKSAE